MREGYEGQKLDKMRPLMEIMNNRNGELCCHNGAASFMERETWSG
jgi:hypothetical protein